ncbi:MAG: HTTM domain-containing protein [Alphaproteobacteria bacterium]|nr:HTTM domain-containing protein [Alphaproteobacteria bacterium]
MSLDAAIRITEILLALAFLQQSIEHFHAPRNEQCLFVPRFILSILLLLGFQTQWVCLALVILGLFILKRFQGPYNGGSDRMSLLILCCLSLVLFMPTTQWKEYVFGYLALQLVLSYFIAGWVKIINPEWRNGRALQDVFRFSAYPVSEALRKWADWPRLLCLMSWGVMLFELLFPLTLLTQTTLVIGLIIAATFHFTNACLFGLNRFFWIWLAAYPAILWLQQRIFIAG